MTIAFPRSVPASLKVVGMSFLLDRDEELNPIRGGDQLAVNMGPDLWHGTWQSPPLTEEEFGEVRAWFDTLASANAFYGYDTLREYPVAYRLTRFAGLSVSGNPFTGSCFLGNVAGNNVEMSLSSLPVGFIVSPGDYLAFDYLTDSRALHRASAAAIANGSGNLTVEVRPNIRAGWNIGSPTTAVSLYRAAAKMVVVPKSYSEDIDVQRTGRVSFEAMQTP